MDTIVFWLIVVCSTYSYLIYPIVLMFWPPRHSKNIRSRSVDKLPKLSVIIAARNEASRISSKLQDVLTHDYPRDKLEVVVVSDASDDGTDDIVEEFRDRGVILLHKADREGKEAAQLLAIEHAGGDVLVFTDVATRFGAGSLKAMARALAAPGVGAVSSVDAFEGEQATGEGLYVRYEMALRTLESRHAGLVGLSGSFFGVRRQVAEQWRPDIPSDFSAALNSIRLGLRAIHSSEIVGIYPDLKSEADEFGRKRRTAVRGMTALLNVPEVLNPFRYGFFAFQVFSHKIMRWLAPWFLANLFVLSVALSFSYAPSRFLLIGQLAFYVLAAVGWAQPKSRKHRWVKVPFYFTQVNLALAVALVDLCRGRRIVTWEPSKR